MDPIADGTMRTLEYVFRGLQQRSEVRANNVANINTPNFRASRVDFESSLRGALRSGRPERAAAPAVSPDPSYPNHQGNTVNLENEMVGMMKDNLLRDAMVNAYTFKTSVLRTAINGR
jgi:flagellar basal-body rod protein FlgB